MRAPAGRNVQGALATFFCAATLFASTASAAGAVLAPSRLSATTRQLIGTAGPAATTTEPEATATTEPTSSTTGPTSSTTGPTSSTTGPSSTSTSAASGNTTTTVPSALSAPGYWVVTDAGAVASFGGVPYHGSFGRLLKQPIVGLAPAAGASGYWLADQDGSVYPLGNAPDLGALGGGALGPGEKVVAISPSPDGNGYWLVTSQGAVYTFGDATYHGSAQNLALTSPIVAFAPTPNAGGYWMASSDGGVFAYGDAHYYGSAAAVGNVPDVVGFAPTPDGKGYWLATASGEVYGFGDARRLAPSGASMANLTTTTSTVSSSTTSTASSPTTSVPSRSATGTTVPSRQPATGQLAPVVAIQAAPAAMSSTGPAPEGYWLLRSDGSIQAFGAAPFRGDGYGTLPYGQKAVAIAAGPGEGSGVQSAGAFGPSSPSKLVAPATTATTGSPTTTTSPVATTTSMPATTTTTSPSRPVVTTSRARGKPGRGTSPARPGTGPSSGLGPKPQAATHPSKPQRPRRAHAAKPARGKKPFPGKPPSRTSRGPATTFTGPESYPPGARGYDVSWPQCGGPLPPRATVAVVGVNGGWAFTGNPCFGTEARWAGNNLSTYINLNSPRGPDPAQWADGPAGRCARGNFYCESYNYGYNTARFSVRKALADGARSKTWWLDVELGPNWSSNQHDNAAVVAGAIAALRSDGLRPAVYSTTYQWDVITGGFVPGTTAWYPTGTATAHPVRWCWPRSFAGGPVSLVQSAAGRYDGDYAC